MTEAQNAVAARLRGRYETLWSSGIAAIESGKIDLDPTLAARASDSRRGLTVVVRPPPAVQQAVLGFLRELSALEPGQHYYAGQELHVTVLSLFTASVDSAPLLARTADYIAAVDSALAQARPFEIGFEGVTASPGTVMVQGFLKDDLLNEIRDGIREQLHARGLGAGLDERYRLETAHMTVVRFCAPLRDQERFANALRGARQRQFGAARFADVSLVQNDWYMSESVTQTMKSWSLAKLPRHQ